jgi:hypothetical protein
MTKTSKRKQKIFYANETNYLSWIIFLKAGEAYDLSVKISAFPEDPITIGKRNS